VAAHTRLSRRYLEQLAVALKNASLLSSVTGRGGGYRLARPDTAITARQIVEAAIGPISIVDCVLARASCSKGVAERCEFRALYGALNDRIRETLNERLLADMTREDGDSQAAERRSKPERARSASRASSSGKKET
jgi:Rrf2 family iron-sulfur cluster assembly transcriptional regulator